MTKPHFNPEFRREVAELVVDKKYSIQHIGTNILANILGQSRIKNIKM